MINEELACRSYRGTHIYTHIHTRHVYTIKRPTSTRRGEGGCHRVVSRIFLWNFSTTLCLNRQTKSLHAWSKFLNCDAFNSPFPVAFNVFGEDSLSIRRWHFTAVFLHSTTFIIYLYKRHLLLELILKLIKIRYTLRNCWFTRISAFRSILLFLGNVNCKMNQDSLQNNSLVS